MTERIRSPFFRAGMPFESTTVRYFCFNFTPKTPPPTRSVVSSAPLSSSPKKSSQNLEPTSTFSDKAGRLSSAEEMSTVWQRRVYIIRMKLISLASILFLIAFSFFKNLICYTLLCSKGRQDMCNKKRKKRLFVNVSLQKQKNLRNFRRFFVW